MNYCSIEDAWKNSGYISDQYKNYDNKEDIIENFDQTIINYTINDNHVPLVTKEKTVVKKAKINTQKCVFTCDDFIDHVSKCSKCRMKLQKNVSSKFIEKIKHIIFKNKDTVLIVLIVLFIMIFLNLFLSIF
jgi:hypothetical protein